MDHRFSWILVIVAVCLASCSNTNGEQQDKTLAYRDLKGYFQEELHTMSGIKPALQKTIVMNGQRDSLTITSPDSVQLRHLLAPFLDVDLNKPSLRGAYDTILLADQFSGKHSLMYKARNPATVPQEVIMDIDNQQHITNVQMNKHVENLVYEYQQNLVYQQNKHIRIVTWQKIAFLPARELDVKVLLRHP
ncbi:hypothetical protein [Chitinophaga rhizophila]|uniref:DUF1439 domain-containing protein n=1 Tax=Chitinophaga rhizophila TaxID=2866212 RepID=A0ABS7GDT8_9BACT|nr:hypothetical protein [Chitinophaga rhizophila]MBW8685842.1 hypothetical protein [Chitinophaga rhizophila]